MSAGGIRTHNLSRRATVDLRFRPRRFSEFSIRNGFRGRLSIV